MLYNIFTDEIENISLQYFNWFELFDLKLQF